jgi:hypothetical protein
MEKDSEKYWKLAGAFALGVVGMATVSKLFWDKEEETDGEGKKNIKKVKFESKVVQQEELKEIIDMTIKETLENYNKDNSFSQQNKHKAGFKKTNYILSRRRYSESDEPIYKI